MTAWQGGLETRPTEPGPTLLGNRREGRKPRLVGPV